MGTLHYSGDSSASNFDVSTSGQTNEYWVPEIFSKKIQNFFRKSSVIEAITNTDYAGEISAFGDTVKIIKEPTVTVAAYTRASTPSKQYLGDQELSLVIDKANAFKFVIDDIEEKMSHVNWASIGASSAAYTLKDTMDSEVITALFSGVSSSSPDHVIGADSATANAGLNIANDAIDVGFGSGEITPLAVMARLSRLLDEQNVPEEGRWFLANPQWYEELASESSKLMTSDYNQGDGGVRNGLVAAGMVRGFKMYKSNNMPSVSNASGKVICGHISSTATAQSILNIETLRDHDTFGDIVRGLHVYGRQVLRDNALAAAFYIID
jgi:hypothetical protein